MNTVTDPMTRLPVTVHPYGSVQRAAQLMDEINVGIVSLGDMAVRWPEGVQEALGCISLPAVPHRLQQTP